MTPKIPVAPLGSNPHHSTGIASQASTPVAVSRSSAPKPQPQRQDSSKIGLKVQKHGQWAVLSRVQAGVSRVQGLERSVINSYRELAAIARELERNNQTSDQLALKAQQLSQKITQDGHLDNNLQPRQVPARSSYILERVDLVMPRDQSEQLGIRLPNSGTVTLRVPAQAHPAGTIAQLATQLAEYGVEVTANDKGQLRFTGNRDLLSSPWVFQGQGVRVPAGNPVPIQLAPEPEQLPQLVDGLASGRVEQEKQRLRSLLSALEQLRRDLEAQRQQLLSQVQAIRSKDSLEVSDLGERSEDLKTTLLNGDFTLHLNTLMSQANLSRFSVVALLGR